MAQCVGDVFATRVTSTKRSKPPVTTDSKRLPAQIVKRIPNLAPRPGGYPTDIRRQGFQKWTMFSRHSIRFRVDDRRADLTSRSVGVSGHLSLAKTHPDDGVGAAIGSSHRWAGYIARQSVLDVAESQA